MDFALYRSGACYNHPSFMIYTYTGRGGLIMWSKPLKKSTNIQLKTSTKCEHFGVLYRNATSKYSNKRCFFYMGRSGILVIKI